MNAEKKAMLAAATTYSIFGLSFIFSKMALNIAEPMILLCVRFLFSFAALNLLVLTKVVKINLRGKNLLPPILLGILQPVLYYIFENYGLKFTTASFTGIISSISPVFAAILGMIFLRERPNWKQWICMGLSIVGVLMVSLNTSDGQNTITGCLCLLAAYLSASLYTIMSRKLSSNFSPIELTYVMFAVGFVFFVGITFVTYRAETIPMIVNALDSMQFVFSCVYLSILSSIVAFFLLNYAMAKIPVTRAAIFNSFATIVSILAGVIFMGDPFTLISAISFVLILGGVFGVNHFAESK